MIHLNALTWIQLFLIEVGVVLLLIAIYSFAKGTLAYQRYMLRKKEAAVADEQGMESQASEETEPLEDAPVPHAEAAKHVPTGIRAAQLTRTAKVKFVQSFKFLQDSHYSRQKVTFGVHR